MLALDRGVNCLLAIVVLSASLGASRAPFSAVMSVSASAAANPGSSAALGIVNRVANPSILDLDHSIGDLWRRITTVNSAGKGWMATPWLRLHVTTLEGSHSGVDASASFIPFQGWIRPVLSIDGGHCSGGDISSMVRILTRSPHRNAALLRGFAYDYTSAYAGMELSNARIALAVNFGVTRAQYSTQDIQGALEAVTPHGTSTSELATTPRLSPAAKLVFLVRI